MNSPGPLNNSGPVIGIIDYGAGNLRSVENALRFLGAAPRVCKDPAELLLVDGVILPGVGSFGYAMCSLQRAGFVPAIRQALEKRPLLGICLGMQLLFESSEESPGIRGLSVIPGRVRKLGAVNGLKVPNMGWCAVINVRSRLLGTAGASTRYYFAHSYVCTLDDRTVTAMVIDEDGGFAAAVETGLVFGVQFHPEKSAGSGLRVLERYIHLCESRVVPCR